MNETKHKLKFIGKLDSRVVGCQYYNARVKQGEGLNFDRNPGNEFDNNAIEARNPKGEVVGHLPRRHSAFLAPLLDEGQIFLKGSAGEAESNNEIPIVMEVHVTAKGQSILTPKVSDDDKDLVHAIIAAVYKDCEQYSSGTVQNMAGRFKALTRENVLPQSILLSRLLHWKVKEIAEKEVSKFHELIEARLNSMKAGGYTVYRNLGIIPLYSDEHADSSHILLRDALEMGSINVSEISESGSVPRLKVNNRGKKAVIILAGDELVGAKQNRIVNITIIIPAFTEVIIPVSCVEQNRWSYKSHKFAAGRRANAGLRSKLSRVVRENVRETGQCDGDQGMVWEQVAYMHNCLGTASATGAMNDAYAGVEEDLTGFAENLKYPAGATGIAVFIDGKIIGAETFDSAEVLEKLWVSQIESYAVDSLMSERKEEKKSKAAKSQEKQLSEFLKKVAKNLEQPVKSTGVGYDVGISGKDVTGAACIDGGWIVYMSAHIEKCKKR
jgi:hypothetical protein